MTLDTRPAISAAEARGLDTDGLRRQFLIDDLFRDGDLRLVHTPYDRYVVGAAVPTGGPLALEPFDELRADYFLQRRELGAVNVGGAGTVTVDGEAHALGPREALYVGRGHRDVAFESDDAGRPARFYLGSAPAHRDGPVQRVTEADAETAELGSAAGSNARTLRKLIVAPAVDVNQLQMGMTTLHSGSAWNTMPAHTHGRRMEVYLYFDVPDGEAVAHFMGEPDQTRVVWVQNEQAVISPPWSIHAGAGTAPYSFVWSMAGENLDYGDMDPAPTASLR